MASSKLQLVIVIPALFSEPDLLAELTHKSRLFWHKNSSLLINVILGNGLILLVEDPCDPTVNRTIVVSLSYDMLSSV